MKAVILVGGQGTRLRPLTCNIPKSMVPVLNRPFLEHMIGHLKSNGICEIVLAMGYLPNHVQRYFGDGANFGVKLTYVVESSPLGTAGAVKNVEQYLDDTFLVFNGDIFSDIDLRAMIKLHLKKKARATIALTPVEDPSIYWVVETNAEGRVQRFIEKPKREEAPSNMINAGAYVLEPEVLRIVPSGQSYSFERQLFPSLIDTGDPVYGYPSNAYWIDIGTPGKYFKLHQDLLRGKAKSTFPGEQVDEGVWVEEGCDIHPKAKIEGPAIIGKNCVVASQVRLKGPSVIGQGCQIGRYSLIEGAIVWGNTRLGQRVALRNCVVAESVFIGDRSRITAGCVLGGDVIIGCDESLAPGATVWPENFK